MMLIPRPADAGCVTTPSGLAPVLYVSPAGSDSNSCTLAAPCLTLQTAIQRGIAVAGSHGAHIVLRGGRYYDTAVSIDGYAGSTARRLMIEAYATEVPQFNDLGMFSVTNSSYVNVCDVQLRWASVRGFYFSSSTYSSLENVLAYYSGPTGVAGANGIYWSNVGFSKMVNVQVSRSGSHGINLVNSSLNTLEGITTTVNSRSGLVMSGGQFNYIDQISANYNFDPLGNGESADGISISSGGNHTIKNCTTSHNDDDGIDTWASTDNYIEACVSSYNGPLYANPYRTGPANTAGDGNGYKLGPGGDNTVVDSLASNNSGYGFAKNSGPGNACQNDRAVGNHLGATSFTGSESCKVNVQPY
jgi:hypothetical protein